MTRLWIAAGALSVLLFAPHSAWAMGADASACTDASEMVSASARAAAFLPPLLPTLAIDDARSLSRAVNDARTSPLDDSSVPWCATPDDPRCSPMDGGSLPPDVSAQPKLSLASTLVVQWPVARELNLLPPLAAAGAARSAAHVRLERPPRCGG